MSGSKVHFFFFPHLVAVWPATLLTRPRVARRQVVNFRTINKEFGKLRPIAFKIAMQINCKLGGELWACRMPVGSTMLCGVDVYHDSPRQKSNSVLAFVSALNPDQTRYHSQARVQRQGQELGDTLSTCLLTAVRQWHRANNALPEHIVIFRDGVGEGQLAATEMHEIPQYETVFSAFGDDYKPKLNVVIVQKRINTRIFSAQVGDGGGVTAERKRGLLATAPTVVRGARSQ